MGFERPSNFMDIIKAHLIRWDDNNHKLLLGITLLKTTETTIIIRILWCPGICAAKIDEICTFFQKFCKSLSKYILSKMQ